MHGMKKRIGSCVIYSAVITIFLVSNTIVYADDNIPYGCRGVYEERAYIAGKALGEGVVTMVWRSIDDCDRIDYFKSAIIDIADRANPPCSSSLVTVCRYAGYINGMMALTREIYGQCVAPCYEEGDIIGQLSGKAYCVLMLSLPWGFAAADDFFEESVPVQGCGFEFESACNAAFISTTLGYSNTCGPCEPYTNDEWFPIWDEVRDHQCAYNVLPPPL